MQVYLPIAETAVAAELIFLVSGLVGLLSGLFGIGGGFLTTPFLMFMGVPPAVAVGTQSSQIVANATSGMIGYMRRGDVDIKMAGFMILGSVGGSIIGIIIFNILRYIGQIDFTISFLYAVLLVTIGSLMLGETVWSSFRQTKHIRSEFNRFRVSGLIDRLPLKMRFPRSKLYISAFIPMGVGFVSGIIASILGIGGGFLLVPAMIYLIGMPGLVVAGTSLLQIVFSTAFAVLLHAVVNNTVDVVLSALLIAGGVIGAQIGVAFAKSIKPLHARLILGIIVLIVGLQLSSQLLIAPDELFSTVIR